MHFSLLRLKELGLHQNVMCKDVYGPRMLSTIYKAILEKSSHIALSSNEFLIFTHKICLPSSSSVLFIFSLTTDHAHLSLCKYIVTAQNNTQLVTWSV